MVEAILTPAYPNSFEMLLNEPFAGAFYQIAADGQSQLLEPHIIDMIAMGIQVVIQVLQRLARGSGQVMQSQGGLQVGQHLIGLALTQSTDAAGNQEKSNVAAFKVDLTPPILALTTPQPITYTHGSTFTLN